MEPTSLIATTAAVVASLLVLAVFVEGTVEYFFSALRSDLLKYVALVIGVAVCVVFNLDLFGAFGLQASVPFVGAIMTGIIVGRGSNYVNDFVSKFREPRQAVIVTEAR